MSLSAKRLAAEAVPVAVILLFWNVLAWVAAMQEVGGPVGTAGTVLAALYVLLRGVVLAPEVTSSRLATGFAPLARDDLEALLYENARVAAPAGVWFLGGFVFSAPFGYIDLLDVIGSALAGAGLGVVGLYAVAVGASELRDGDRSGGTPDASTDDELADDRRGSDGHSST